MDSVIGQDDAITKMRVAFLNRQRDSHPGGDVIAIDATIAALRDIGIDATYITDPWDAATLLPFDLVHVFHVNFGWSRDNFVKTWESGRPYVVTPVLYPDESLGMAPHEISHACRLAEALLPFSNREAVELERWLSYHTPVHVIPNGTSRVFHYRNADDPELGIPERVGVLTVSAREGDKNCDKVRAACLHANIPYFHATGISHDELPAVYKTYRLFVNASESERMSLTVGEALCAGCRVLDSFGNRGNEHYRNLAMFDPTRKVEEMAEIIATAYRQYDWCYDPNDDARALTWSAVAHAYGEIYREVLA